MPQKQAAAVENNFTKGLITSNTGLNFPENAATDTDNTHYSLVGVTSRRYGIDYEENFQTNNVTRANSAMSTYKWNNAGGDGTTQLVVTQVGATLFFYRSSAATVTNPVSNQILVSTVNVASYRVIGSSANVALSECQYTDGNGYLFVFHQDCEPFYCSFDGTTVTANLINIKIRDFAGTVDGLEYNTRPNALTTFHQYNLVNQGWIAGSPWIANTSAAAPTLGSNVFTVQAGLIGISGGQAVTGTSTSGANFSGTVTSYAGTSLTVNITANSPPPIPSPPSSFAITPTNIGYITAWFTAAGNFPSNADVWWYFKNGSDVFDPATTISNVTLATGRAPQGHFILSAFNQDKSAVSGIQTLTTTKTFKRPDNGCWFQGRVWYTGVDAQQQALQDAPYYTWSENIYFSQVTQTASDFGNCFQANDPTSETLFDLLPTDGGVIKIQNAGSIFKLFPYQNGLIVFAANGVWFITGSQGIGFAANDYTITKISSIRSISCTSYINVNGLPYFWNEEGIYTVEPSQNGGMQVNPITVGTIQEFYDAIPTSSKRYARGDYDPIDYNIQWIYKNVEATSVLDGYQFNRILNYNTYNKAFFPYSLEQSLATINSIVYVSYPGSSISPEPAFKYLVSSPDGASYKLTFGDEHDDTYVDFKSVNDIGEDYDSYFIVGYRLRGQAQNKFQSGYVYTYSKNDTPTTFRIQGIWDYATAGDSGKYTIEQLVENLKPNVGIVIRRHKIRGNGLVLQLRVSSVTGQPFSIVGWATYDTINTGV